MAEFSKTTFTVVDLSKIIAFVLCFVVQHYSLKNELHNAVAIQAADKQVFSVQIASISQRVDGLDNKYDFLIRGQVLPADKPKPIKIETE